MDSKIQEKLHALYVEYTKKLPAKIHSIDEQWRQLSQHWSQEGLQGLYHVVHQLCGSAGTYGYQDLSASARILEIYLKSILTVTELAPEQVKKISRLMDDVVRVFIVSTQVKPGVSSENQVKVLQENKMIFILGKTEKFVDEVKLNLDTMGYSAVLFNETSVFNEAVLEKLPGVVIVDTDYLSESEIAILHKLQTRDIPIPLFCISLHGDLITRLRSVRAGCTAFFLKTSEPYYLTKTIDQMYGSSFSEPLRILIIDDSPSLGEYYSIILQEAGMETHSITNPLRTLEVLNDFRPDLLLLDIYMPECSGLELAAVLRQESHYAGIPIIFLSTEDDRYKQLAALNLGGDDFLTKPVLPQHLVSAVKLRAKRAGILSSYMTRDSLTGLLNHTNVLQHLDIELNRAVRLNSTLCYVMVDIDHFKSVNDTYGHTTGDHVLRKLSELLLTRLRKTDLVGRFGGEEFAIILPNTTAEAGMILIAYIRKLFSQCVFKAENDREFSVTFSAGLAIYPDFKESRSLIEAADRALYQAKHEGRNREVFLKL